MDVTEKILQGHVSKIYNLLNKYQPTKLTKQLALNVQKNKCTEIIINYYVRQTFTMPSSCKDCIYIYTL